MGRTIGQLVSRFLIQHFVSIKQQNLTKRRQQGFTLIEIMVASAVMGGALVVMISMHSQALRSNMHAKRMTDCTYLAQSKLEELYSLPWTNASRPSQLADSGAATTATWGFFEHPNSGAQPAAITAGNSTLMSFATGPRSYYVTWDVEDMDAEARWAKLLVRCQYMDRAFNQWKGTTIASFRFRDS